MPELQNSLVGQTGELRFTLEITRAATGKVETFEMIGTPLESDEDEPQQEDSE